MRCEGQTKRQGTLLLGVASMAQMQDAGHLTPVQSAFGQRCLTKRNFKLQFTKEHMFAPTCL
eukprot:1072697-Prorocentrum_minimum.AAC.1